jgi:RNA polymerase-binding transcription factor
MEHELLKLELEKRLDSLQSRLLKLKSDVAQPHSGDSVEQAQERENDEVLDALGIETARSIGRISAALDRIQGGTYGSCECCGEPIDKARLEAMPEAARCLDCAR